MPRVGTIALAVGITLFPLAMLASAVAHAGVDAPWGLSAREQLDGITLTWEPPSTGADAVTGYQVLRSMPNNGETDLRVHVDDTGSPETTWTDDTALELGRRYVYSVTARRGDELSGRSGPVQVDRETRDVPIDLVKPPLVPELPPPGPR